MKNFRAPETKRGKYDDLIDWLKRLVNKFEEWSKHRKAPGLFHVLAQCDEYSTRADPDAFYAQKEREHHANLDAIEAEAEEQQWFEENDDYGPYNAESEWEAQPCQHEGCTETGNPCWLLEYDKPEGHGDEPDMWYCDAHMHSAGFCRGCGTFWGGVESFDFGSGFCEHCETEFEEPDADDYYSDFDYYDGYFYYP